MTLRIQIIGLALLALASSIAHAGDKRVLVIGIDGAGGSYVQKAETPHLDALAAGGSVRYDFLNEGALVENAPEPYGASGVNWSTINTGASAASHGVLDNTFEGNNFAAVPHWFKYAKEHGPTLFTASIVSWAPINEMIVPDAYADLEVQPAGATAETKDQFVRDAVVDLLSMGDPDAVFVQFDQVDAAGHRFTWGSSRYFAAIQTVDSLIGDITSALSGRPGVVSGAEDWLVMVTADHGGEAGGLSHVASQGPINWEIPLFVSGPSIVDGASLEQGTLRDIAATALWHLGVDPLPETVEGRAVPEPCSFWLLAIASVGLLLCLSRSRRIACRCASRQRDRPWRPRGKRAGVCAASQGTDLVRRHRSPSPNPRSRSEGGKVARLEQTICK